MRAPAPFPRASVRHPRQRVNPAPSVHPVLVFSPESEREFRGLLSLRLLPMSRCAAPESPLTPRSQVLIFSAVFSASSSASPRLRVKTQPASPEGPDTG